MKKQTLRCCILLALAGFFTACQDGQDTLAGRHNGQRTVFGEGTAQTYVVTDENSLPTEIGVAVDAEAYEHLGHHDLDLSNSMAFPTEAARTPFQHTLFDWVSHGHGPTGIYDQPHFDVHFYTTPEAERAAISLADSVPGRNFPAPDYFPANYVPGDLVPLMGIHWVDLTSSEFTGQVFTNTFIYGSFDGRITFIEPMITKAFVDDKQSFETDIRQPARYDESGKYYPLRYGFRFDAARREYQFYMRDFVQR